MNDPFPSSACPDCGEPLPPGSPQALCPACLMRQALASRTILDGDQPAAASPPLTPEELGEKFPGYEILECLGRGGMGVVYKARQKSLNRLVAIKILAPERGSETRFAERFAREAELLAKLYHPHIVTIHDFGETAGLFYLVMEYIDGVNLRDLLRDGKLEAKQALAIVPPICDALQYAHDKGIVHRDIKPENLLLDRDGRIKIADFGIAKLIEGRDAPPGRPGDHERTTGTAVPTHLNAATLQAGTQGYSAPEQANGAADHRADIYSLGVVLYEMLTGERPNKEVVAPSKKVHIDVRLDEIVLRALEKTPELRYQSAGIFKTQVETIVSEMGSAAVPAAMIGIPPNAAAVEASRGMHALPDSRFSRTAIVGACLMLIHAILLPLVHYRGGGDFTAHTNPDRPPFTFLVYPEWALFVCSLIAMTILGWKAVGQIRGSGGRLRGMWLALFDGLFLPVVLASAACALGLGFLLRGLSQILWSITGRNPHLGMNHWFALVLCLLVFTSIVIRRVWRKVNQPISATLGSDGSEEASSENKRLGWIAIALTSLLVAASVGMLVFGATAIVGAIKSRVFVATATVMPQTEPAGARVNESQTLAGILHSDEFLTRVAETTDLQARWKHELTSEPSLQPEQIVSRMRKNLMVTPHSVSPVFDVSYHDPDPKIAVEIANALANQFALEQRAIILDKATTPTKTARLDSTANLALGAAGGGVLGIIIGGLTALWLARGHESAQTEPSASFTSQPRITSAVTSQQSFVSRMAAGLGAFGILAMFGAIANFHFMLGVEKTSMVITGAILFAAGCIGWMLTARAATPPQVSGRESAPTEALPNFANQSRLTSAATIQQSIFSRMAAGIIAFGILAMLGAIANFHFMLGVEKTAMVITGAILFAAGCIGWMLAARAATPPQVSGGESAAAGSHETPRDQSIFTSAATANKSSALGKWALGLFIGAVLGFPLLSGIMGAQEVIVLCGLALLVSLVLGLMSWRSQSGKFAALASGLALLLLVVFTVIYITPRYPARDGSKQSRQEVQDKLPNRVLFTFSHDRNRKPMIGHRIALPIQPEGDTGWQPANGHATRLADGRTVLFKARVAQSKAEGTVGKVATKTDYEPEWRENQQHLRSDGPSTLTFANGLQVSMSADHSDEHANPNSIALVPVSDQSQAGKSPAPAWLRTPAIGIGVLLMVSLALGVMGWRTRVGKFAAIVSGLGLLLCVAFAYNSRPPRKIYGGGRISAYTQVKDNLYAAMSAHYGTKESRFELGKSIDLDLLFQNYSSIDIVVNPPELPLTAGLTVTDSNGTRVELTGQNEAALVLKEPRVLKTGQGGTGGYAMSLLLLPKNDTSTAPKAKADAMAWVEPGTYNLQFHLRLPPASYKPDGSSQNIYSTVPLTIEVVGPPTTDQTTKQLEPPDLSFGPVTERELRVDEDTLCQGLNFDNGKVLTLTLEEFNRVDNYTDARLYQNQEVWLKAKGVDMFATAGEKGFGVGGLVADFKLAALPLAAWNTANASELVQALEGAVMEGDKVYHGLIIPADSPAPLTYAMRSGDKLGLLQITARLQNPDGIKLRYKLVQQGVIDQVVPNVYARGLEGVKCFDFESNRFHTPPEALAAEILGAVNSIEARHGPGYPVSPALIGWLDQTGVDVVAASDDSSAELLLIDPGQLRNKAFPHKTLKRIAYLYWPRKPVSGFYGFITREGNRGDLQITGITDDRFRDVKIRYKLVKDANTPPKEDTSAILPSLIENQLADGSWGEHFQHGEIRRAQDGLDDALASYRRSLAAAQAEMKQRPQDAAWQAYGQRRIKKSHTRIGDVLCAQGDLAGALENYRAAKESFEPLVRKEPADEEQRNELIALYVKIGDVLQARGDQAAALATYRKAQEFDFPDFETWEEHFKSLGGNYNPTKPFNPEELRQLAAKPLNEDDNRDLAELIRRAGAEKDAGFRYLLEKPELRKDEDVNLALIAYDYSINGNAKALDDLLARLAKERRGSDSSVAATLAFVDEWDRVPKAMKAHFTGADGSGADLACFCEAWTAYHFPRNSLQYEGKAGEGAPLPPKK